MLHERPSPDGGEDLIQESQNCNSNSSHLLQESNDDDNEQWIDWESVIIVQFLFLMTSFNDRVDAFISIHWRGAFLAWVSMALW